MKQEVQEQIAAALEQLFGAVTKLQAAYPGKPFTLDGRLVGDIGEVVASLHYRVTLNEGLTKHHDAIADDGRNVQIKTTFSKNLTFPVDHVPDYYLGIKLSRDGTFEEIYNGPGQLIKDELKRRAPTTNGLHGNLMSQLKRINLTVPDEQRIPRR
ncbi:DUF6998 domain-containing protein [Pseudomonas chlororaphis]|uniref:DUF6998 domain-containing protein n=1 Tax=Pseudomonas chlororaphis TaxID=587753 RepID=UPI000F5626FF|nr:hypothetical protein [Pseudomonas chlororaphis]WDG45662.1 hypothetical protein PUP58_18025 [Pseudomonas chlororaphis]